MAKSVSSSGSKLDRLDTFVLAGVVTILLTRAFLGITGFPQIGSTELHVAHVLYGGAILVIAFLFLLLSEKPNKLAAALLGGIGFGLFIDEVGKFVTQDNDYFYRPAFGLMYICFLLIWFIARLIIVRNNNMPFLSPAEWPTKRWQRSLIRIWCGVVGVFGLLVVGLNLIERATTTQTLSISILGIVATFVYAVFLLHGLWRCRGGETPAAANDLRGATLFGIAVVFPFYYLHYPVASSIVLAPTLLVIIGLSEISFLRLLMKLSPKN